MVSIPGMMTGAILGGAPVEQAIYYQVRDPKFTRIYIKKHR